MKFYILIILCIIQGLTEFLPVSSSGHLLLVEKIFGIQDNILLINLFLHLATLFAVVVIYRKVIWQLIKRPFQPLTFKLIISTIITVVFAGIYEYFELGKYLENYFGFYFLITAILLLITHIFQKKANVISVGDIGYKSAITVGIVQGFAVLPGISRSGSTISSLVLLGNSETKSSEYSFLLSIPIIIGGFIVELIKVKNWSVVLGEIGILEVVIAFFITFFVALVSIKLTIRLLKQNKFIYFSIYLFILGMVTIVLL